MEAIFGRENEVFVCTLEDGLECDIEGGLNMSSAYVIDHVLGSSFRALAAPPIEIASQVSCGCRLFRSSCGLPNPILYS